MVLPPGAGLRPPLLLVGGPGTELLQRSRVVCSQKGVFLELQQESLHRPPDLVDQEALTGRTQAGPHQGQELVGPPRGCEPAKYVGEAPGAAPLGRRQRRQELYEPLPPQIAGEGGQRRPVQSTLPVGLADYGGELPGRQHVAQAADPILQGAPARPGQHFQHPGEPLPQADEHQGQGDGFFRHQDPLRARAAQGQRGGEGFGNFLLPHPVLQQPLPPLSAPSFPGGRVLPPFSEGVVEAGQVQEVDPDGGAPPLGDRPPEFFALESGIGQQIGEPEDMGGGGPPGPEHAQHLAGLEVGCELPRPGVSPPGAGGPDLEFAGEDPHLEGFREIPAHEGQQAPRQVRQVRMTWGVHPHAAHQGKEVPGKGLEGEGCVAVAPRRGMGERAHRLPYRPHGRRA